MTRDPRVDPRPGDVLDVQDDDFGRCECEVLRVWANPTRLTFRSGHHILCGPVSLDEWIALNADAVVVTVADEVKP